MIRHSVWLPSAKARQKATKNNKKPKEIASLQ